MMNLKVDILTAALLIFAICSEGNGIPVPQIQLENLLKKADLIAIGQIEKVVVIARQKEFIPNVQDYVSGERSTATLRIQKVIPEFCTKNEF
jgi:hypothetical protein